MNTKNTKTAVIILLIIANIYFIYNIISLKISSENITSEMIDDAVIILGRNGFIVDKNKVPVKKPANRIYEGEYTENIFAEIVGNFSGVSGEEIEETGGMFNPWGVSYTVGDYRFMFSGFVLEGRENPIPTDKFKISIIDRNYSAFEKDYKELEEETQRDIELLFEKDIGENQKGDIKKAERAIKNFIKKYQNQDIRLGFEIIGFGESGEKNCECVLINQTVDGTPLGSHTAYIEIRNGKVKYFSGKWYFGGLSVIARRTKLLDSVNILFKCLDIDRSTVQSERLLEMNQEYNVIYHNTENTVKFYLAPAWQLVFESGKKLSYDMMTGEKKL